MRWAWLEEMKKEMRETIYSASCLCASSASIHRVHLSSFASSHSSFLSFESMSKIMIKTEWTDDASDFMMKKKLLYFSYPKARRFFSSTLDGCNICMRKVEYLSWHETMIFSCCWWWNFQIVFKKSAVSDISELILSFVNRITAW